MSSRLLGRVAGFALLALLVACGGGDDGDPGPQEEIETIDWSGRWEIRENTTVYESYSPACRAGDSTSLLTFNVSQNDDGIVTVGTSYGTFSAFVEGDTIEWSGTFFNQRSNRWTTFESLTFRFVPGGQNYPDYAIGENVFEHYADESGPGLRLCRGWSALSAIRTSQ